MILTREKALELHRQMWSDMRVALGDRPSHSAREVFKQLWCDEHFPDDPIMFNCFLCHYADIGPNGYTVDCRRCPIDWSPLYPGKTGRDRCYSGYGDEGVPGYHCAPISDILALPEREAGESHADA